MTDARQGSTRFAEGSAREATSTRTRREGSGRSGGHVVGGVDRERRDNILYAFFIVQVISVTVLQKFGIGNSAGLILPLAIVLMLGGLLVTVVLVRPVFDVTRLTLFVLFMAAAFVSTGVFATQYSFASLILLVLLYLPLAFSFPTSDANYRRCMNFFSNVMVGLAGVTIAQMVIQVVLSWTWWPNLHQIFPESVLIPGFNYIQPVVWRSAYMKPNAVVFLEVSFLSQYLALALAAEIVLFQRTWRIGLFAAVILGSFAGTGLLLLALTLPVLVGRVKIGTMALIILALAIIALGAYELGWFDAVSRRMTEYRHNGSSANLRFVAPLDRLVDFARMPGSFYSGIGAGQIEKTVNSQWWPITKASVEYGFLTGILFYGFIFYALLKRPPYRRIAFTLAVWFSIEGALLTAVNPLTVALFSTLFVLDRGRRKRRTGEGGGDGAGGERVREAGDTGARGRRSPIAAPA